MKQQKQFLNPSIYLCKIFLSEINVRQSENISLHSVADFSFSLLQIFNFKLIHEKIFSHQHESVYGNMKLTVYVHGIHNNSNCSVCS